MTTQPHHTPPGKVLALAQIRDRHPGTSCDAQRARLREALASYSITTFEGTRYLDCYDTRKRISELRDEGEPIIPTGKPSSLRAGRRTVWGCMCCKAQSSRHTLDGGRYEHAVSTPRWPFACLCRKHADHSHLRRRISIRSDWAGWLAAIKQTDCRNDQSKRGRRGDC